MARRQKEEIDVAVTEGTSNVFEDIGLRDAPEFQAKAELTHQIYVILKERKLSQRAAAKMLGVAQPDVSALMNGRHTGFSLARLMALLNRLGRDVEIVVRRRPTTRKSGAKLHVRAA